MLLPVRLTAIPIASSAAVGVVDVAAVAVGVVAAVVVVDANIVVFAWIST